MKRFESVQGKYSSQDNDCNKFKVFLDLKENISQLLGGNEYVPDEYYNYFEALLEMN